MKKAIFNSYGDTEVIKIINVERPNISNKEVLVKVKAAALNPKDILVRKGKFKRLTGKKFPQGIGFDFSGVIEESQDTNLKKGDKVFGMVNGWYGRCCAEFVNVHVDEITKAPEHISHEALAGIPLAAQTALQAIRDIGQLKKGQSICINGASGGVGTLAIQIAKELGGQVTSISSKKNIAFCQSLGADHTLAYDEMDILKTKNTFDIFFDVFGNYSYKKTNPILSSRGKYITTVPKPAIFVEQFFNFFRKKKAKIVVVKSKAVDLEWLAIRLENHQIKPVVDKIFLMNDIHKAQKYIESKRAKGKVIIQMDTKSW